MAKKKGKPQQNNHVADIDKLHITDTLFYGLMETMTDEQIEFAESIIHNDVTFCNAKAGTGKTTIAVACAKFLVEHHLADKLVYISSAYNEGELGYRPGDTAQKVADYMTPLQDALIAINEFPERALNPMEGWVSFQTDTFLRGTNLSKAVVILDEAQNMTKSQIKKTITRCHDDVFLIIIGHDGQVDIRNPEQSGFIPMLNLFVEKGEEVGLKIGNCKLTVNFRGKISQLADTLEVN